VPLAHSTQNLAPGGLSRWRCVHCVRTSARGPVLYAKFRHTRKLCGVGCHQGEVSGKRDRRDQQIAFSDRPAAEEIIVSGHLPRGSGGLRDDRQHLDDFLGHVVENPNIPDTQPMLWPTESAQPLDPTLPRPIRYRRGSSARLLHTVGGFADHLVDPARLRQHRDVASR